MKKRDRFLNLFKSDKEIEEEQRKLQEQQQNLQEKQKNENQIKEEQEKIQKQQQQNKQKENIIMDENQFEFILRGGEVHTQLIQAECMFKDQERNEGMPVPIQCKWFLISEIEGTMTSLDKVTGQFYQPCIDDVDKKVCVQAVPILDDEEYEGMPIRKEVGPITLDQQIKDEADLILDSEQTEQQLQLLEIEKKDEKGQLQIEQLNQKNNQIILEINQIELFIKDKVTYDVLYSTELNETYPQVQFQRSTQTMFDIMYIDINENIKLKLRASSNQQRDILSVSIRYFCGRRMMMRSLSLVDEEQSADLMESDITQDQDQQQEDLEQKEQENEENKQQKQEQQQDNNIIEQKEQEQQQQDQIKESTKENDIKNTDVINNNEQNNKDIDNNDKIIQSIQENDQINDNNDQKINQDNNQDQKQKQEQIVQQQDQSDTQLNLSEKKHKKSLDLQDNNGNNIQEDQQNYTKQLERKLSVDNNNSKEIKNEQDKIIQENGEQVKVNSESNIPENTNNNNNLDFKYKKSFTTNFDNNSNSGEIEIENKNSAQKQKVNSNSNNGSLVKDEIYNTENNSNVSNKSLTRINGFQDDELMSPQQPNLSKNRSEQQPGQKRQSLKKIQNPPKANYEIYMKLNDMSQKVQKLQQENTQLNNKLNESNENNAQISNKLDTASEQLNNLTQNYFQVTKLKQSLEQQNDLLQKENCFLSQELNSQIVFVEDTKQNYQQCKDKYERLVHQVEQQKPDKIISIDEYEQQKILISDLQLENFKKSQQIIEVEEKFKLQQQQVKQLQEQIDKLNDDKKYQKKLYDSLKKEKYMKFQILNYEQEMNVSDSNSSASRQYKNPSNNFNYENNNNSQIRNQNQNGQYLSANNLKKFNPSPIQQVPQSANNLDNIYFEDDTLSAKDQERDYEVAKLKKNLFMLESTLESMKIAYERDILNKKKPKNKKSYQAEVQLSQLANKLAEAVTDKDLALDNQKRINKELIKKIREFEQYLKENELKINGNQKFGVSQIMLEKSQSQTDNYNNINNNDNVDNISNHSSDQFKNLQIKEQLNQIQINNIELQNSENNNDQIKEQNVETNTQDLNDKNNNINQNNSMDNNNDLQNKQIVQSDIDNQNIQNDLDNQNNNNSQQNEIKNQEQENTLQQQQQHQIILDQQQQYENENKNIITQQQQ